MVSPKNGNGNSIVSLVLVLLAVLGGVGGIYLYMGREIQMLEAHVAELKGMDTRLAVAEDNIEDVEKDLDKVSDSGADVRELQIRLDIAERTLSGRTVYVSPMAP